MPDPPTIRRVASLRGLGVFRDYPATADVPELRRYNLIYGFNGSGKTTLARVFASLEAGSPRPELPEGGTFEVELTDDTVIRSNGPLDALKNCLVVFSVDFIQDNLRWKDGTAKPVFYIGKAQAELAKQLQEMEVSLAASDQKQLEAERDCTRVRKAFVEHNRDTARLISEQLGLGRKYHAGDLVEDYSNASYADKTSEADIQRLRKAITQDAPLPKLSPREAMGVELGTYVRNLRRTLHTTLGTMTLDDLRQNESMMKWVKEGFDYHQQHDLSSCLFCGNRLTEERVRALGKAIDDRFDQLASDVIDAKQKAEELRDRLFALKASIPSENDISHEHQARFTAAAVELRAILARGIDIIATVLALLAKKSASPNLRVDPGELATDPDAATWDLEVGRLLSDLNAVVEAHNKTHEAFSEVQEKARTKLKHHFLADNQARYRAAGTAVAAATVRLDDLKSERIGLKEGIEHLKQQMRQHGPAAGVINGLLHGYLGHGELEIGTLETGYEIRRNGRSVRGSLSEGEKTAIALCYFLATLEAEGRNLKNLIVVVDDPISSLDTRALHYAFSMIKGSLEGASQLIVMTHNLQFMNEVKKWLKTKVGKETATLLFLDAVQEAGTDTRSASIKVLPKLIRDYESEYQYLFHLILAFASSSDGHTDHSYLMPNALRKVLEIFLAFKVPGPDGLGNKVEAVLAAGKGLDPARVRALDRLVQLESHADNLDDLVAFSSMTIEETRDATRALLELVETLDKDHYDRLCRICG